MLGLSDRNLARIALWLQHAFAVAFFAFLLAPILIVVVYSFSDAAFVTFPVTEFSLRWYKRMIEYTPFLTSLGFSLQIAVGSAILATIVGVPAALSLARSTSPFAEGLMTFLLAPLSMPMILLGIALLYYLSWLGLGISPLSLLIGHTVVSIPYMVRTVAAVYQAAGRNQEEAALILGATRPQVFRHITLPMIRPGILSGALFAILISLDNLPISFFFSGSGTNTLPVVMLAYQQNQFDPAIAAISTVQMVIALLALLFVQRLTGLRHIIGQSR